MVNTKFLFADKIAIHLEGVTTEDISRLMEVPPKPELGDLSLPCFQLSKVLKKSPQVIAENLKEHLKDDLIEKIEAVSGYLNITLNKPQLAKRVIGHILNSGEQYGAQNFGKGKTVVIDYSSPNIAKPFHVAHLRSTVIGHALVQIFKFMGYKSIGINHLGDWGTQFGKLIVAYRLWGNAGVVENKGIDELLRLYIQFHDEAKNNQ